jgi:hypothetical protein
MVEFVVSNGVGSSSRYHRIEARLALSAFQQQKEKSTRTTTGNMMK